MDCTTITTEGQTALATLADEINQEHRAATEAATSALEHAQRCGELLTEAKAACPHGTWLAWLNEHFEGTPRLAQQYMRVADRWPEIESNTKHVSHLSFREALRLTAEPKPDTTTRDWFAGVDEDFAALIPEPSPDQVLYGSDEDDQSYRVEVYPSIEHPGFYHLILYKNLDERDDREPYVDFNSRPCKYTARSLAYSLQRSHGIKPTIWESKPSNGQIPAFIESGLERMKRVCREALERGAEENEESTEAKELRELEARIEANMPIVRPLLEMLDKFDNLKPDDVLTREEAYRYIGYVLERRRR